MTNKPMNLSYAIEVKEEDSGALSVTKGPGNETYLSSELVDIVAQHVLGKLVHRIADHVSSKPRWEIERWLVQVAGRDGLE